MTRVLEIKIGSGSFSIFSQRAAVFASGVTINNQHSYGIRWAGGRRGAGNSGGFITRRQSAPPGRSNIQ